VSQSNRFAHSDRKNRQIFLKILRIIIAKNQEKTKIYPLMYCVSFVIVFLKVLVLKGFYVQDFNVLFLFLLQLMGVIENQIE